MPAPSRNPVPTGVSPSAASSLGIGRRVVAFVTGDATMASLRSGLAALGHDLDLRQGNIRSAIRYFEKDTPGQAIIVDVADGENAQPVLDELARVCPSDVRVFVIGDNTDISFYRLLVRDLGVAEYLPKPLTRDMVQRLLLPHLAGAGVEEPAAPRGGHLVAVCGARGGAGTSSIALNLACEIAGRIKGHVALVDLHIQGGEIALMLAQRPGPGLRLALEDPRRLDGLFLERIAIPIRPRLRLIASEESFDSDVTITQPGVMRLLSVLQQRFNHIVADIPMPLPAQMAPVLNFARQVVVVLTPDVASLRDTQSIRRLVSGATGTDRVVTVLNRADMKGGLSRRQIEKALGAPPDVVLPDLGRRMLEAINLGVPAIEHLPRLRRHLAPLVQEIAGPPESGPASSWLRQVFR